MPNEGQEMNGEGYEDIPYGGQEGPMYNTMDNGQRESNALELEMQLLDASPETNDQIKEIVNCIKSQNYEEAKKISEFLMANQKIWFTPKKEEDLYDNEVKMEVDHYE
mmetsp:Transcript_20699/g.18348  ORF Transcript_20699/g.18348 Transcript_20699/m.18348 type:complete len:108 (-) Transcript_20699:8-331(-)